MISKPTPKPKPLKAAEVERQVRDLLQKPLDAPLLRTELEKLAVQPAFSGLTWLWGPDLYRRNRLLFRPFILSHFASWQFDPPLSWKTIYWKGDTGNRLELWLREADRFDDIPLFKRLYQWKLSATSAWKIDPAPMISDLKQRFAAAAGMSERTALVQKFDLWFEIDEPSALELYQQDPKVAGPFVLKHLPNKLSWWGGAKRELWKNLHAAALNSKDEKTAFTLYRRQVPLADWEKEAMSLCDKVLDASTLCDSLEQRHPEGWGLDLGNAFAKLLEKRGLAVWPYLRKHLFQIHQGLLFKTGYDSMLALAKKEGWWPIWAALLKSRAAQKDFNREILSLVQNRDLPDQVLQERLLMLTGVAREMNFSGFGMAQVKPLDDDTVLALYERFPHLVRGPFRMHLVFSYGYAYPKTIERFLAAGENDLIDYLASRAATRLSGWGSQDALKAAERLSQHYEELRKTPDVFSRRSANVLGQIPALSIYGYQFLIEKNRLARLLFERSLSSWLDDPLAVGNLVEASEIHVQQLAYRILGQPGVQAAQAAHANLPILLGTLLRPLHRRTRGYAFKALENAALDLASARQVLDKARQAQDLPDTHYPKETLLGLMARVLKRWPELRLPAEVALIYEREARA